MYNVIGKVNIEIYFILYYLTAAYHEGAITANASPTKYTGCADTRPARGHFCLTGLQASRAAALLRRDAI